MFGSTEGAIALDRTGGPPRGSIGALREDVAIVDPEGNPVPVAEFDEDGRLTNADACVGEIVNTSGVGPFEGYYKNDEAMRATTRNGWYWSGDLGYIDADGWVYFAGRTADWLRVDGENFPAGPIDSVITRHPDVMLGAVYGVPDVFAGDQVMVGLVLNEVPSSTPTGSPAGWRNSRTSPPSGTRGTCGSPRPCLRRRPTRFSFGCCSTRSSGRTEPVGTRST